MRGFKRAIPTVTRVIRLLAPIAKRLAVGLVDTCFNVLGLSLPEIEPRSSACKANALSLIHNDSLHEASLRLAVP